MIPFRLIDVRWGICTNGNDMDVVLIATSLLFESGNNPNQNDEAVPVVLTTMSPCK
jgi:hypothetical protein